MLAPTRKVYRPRPYGAAATQHLLDLPRAALYGSPGVGKTVTVLTALDIKYRTYLSRPTLILATLRVARSTWTDELAKWEHLSGLTIVPIIGSEAQRLAAVKRDAPIYTTNYENLVWLTEYWGDRWPYEVVVADESTRLKSHRVHFQTARKHDGSPGKTFLAGFEDGGKRAGALARLTHTRIKEFYELTGTPAPNGLKDLWGQIWYLDAGRRLGRTYGDFMARWFEKGYDGYEVTPRPYAAEQIHAAVGDLCMSINAKDYFPLKDPVIVPVYVELPAAARSIYRDMERKFEIEIEGRHVTAVNSAVKSLKTLQIANGACYLDPATDVIDPMSRKEWRQVHDVKLQALDSLISELNGNPVIVVYEFWSDLQRLQKAFPKARTLRTQQDEDDFKAGKVPVLLIHPASAGHGIDGFHVPCHNMIFFSHSWNLEYYQQVVERIGPTRQYQIGSERNVFLYFIIARDTMDEDVMERRASKRSVQDILLEAVKRRAAGQPSLWQLRQEMESLV